MVNFEDFFEEKCCACKRIIGKNGKHVNGVILNRLAEWKYPTVGNIVTGEKGKALAIVCDKCLKNNTNIKYAVKFEIKKIVYVPVEKLKKECEKSPNGGHCWHMLQSASIFIPSGTNTITDVCCWCDEQRSYDAEYSYSMPELDKEHGPYYKTQII